ncbi:MAG: hypothetical protein LUQ65_08325 [Candidatus Helarchaeota archaeon]|nr:hypothetical protein [Candidatus Helarchaeota archaeon]
MKKKLLFIFLVMFLLAGFLIQTASSTTETVEAVSVQRTIHIDYDKIFKVTDQYTFRNTGPDPISSLLIEVPYGFSSNLALFQLCDANSELLSFEKLPYDGSTFMRWCVYLNAPLLSGHNVTIRNEMAFVGISSDYGDTAVDGVKGHINFYFYKFPTSPYHIQKCNVTVTCDSRVTLYDSMQGKYFSQLSLVSNVAVSKNNFTAYNSRYNLTEPSGYDYTLSAIKYPTFKREIRIDPWGYLYISEEREIEHFGPYGNFRVNKFTFNLSSDAENIHVFDEFGGLIYSISGTTTKSVTVDLDASRYTLLYHESVTYWITYRLPLSNYMTQNGDKLKINLNILFGDCNGVVDDFAITIVLPKDTSLNKLLPSADYFSSVGNNILIGFNETDVTPYNSKMVELEIDISNSYPDMFSRPLILLLIFGSICSGYVIVKRVLPSKERWTERKTVVPTPVLLEFCSLCEEKVALVTEIEELEEDMKRRRIKKRDYRNDLKNKEKRIFELNKDIEDLKVTLKDAGGRFAQIVNEIEINEAERQSTTDGLYNLEQRYLRKKISIVAYQKLSDDLINRHKKAKTRIDKLLFELREILS